MVGKVNGYLSTISRIDQGTESEVSHFATLETIKGLSEDRLCQFTLYECIVTNVNYPGVFYPGLGMPFDADLLFDALTTDLLSHNSWQEPTRQYDWFLSNQFKADFQRTTVRRDRSLTRIREEEDDANDLWQLGGASYSHDWFEISIPSVKCSVGLVPKEFGPSWAKCLVVEYYAKNGRIEERVKRGVINLLGWLLGTELFFIGTTIFCEEAIISQIASSPQIGGAQYYFSKSGWPPIKFNRKYEWGNIEWLMNALLPNYLQQMNSFQLNEVVWRYFQATELAVGVNLPILSSAFDSLANSYLRTLNFPTTYLAWKDFLDLIAPELESIRIKLKGVPGAERILNKIKSACNRGGNEMIEVFFDAIGLKLSLEERAAIKARNAMAHGNSGYETKEEAKPVIVKTRIYQTLFHRTLLRLLRYEFYYTDYALPGRPSKNIDLK